MSDKTPTRGDADVRESVAISVMVFGVWHRSDGWCELRNAPASTACSIQIISDVEWTSHPPEGAPRCQDTRCIGE